MTTKFQFYLLDPFVLTANEFMQYAKSALPQMHQWDPDILDIKNAEDPDFRKAVLSTIDQTFSCVNDEDEVSL